MNHFIQYRPDINLLNWLLIMFILDFIFGFVNAGFCGRQRTSGGLRKSVIKFVQYGGCIIIAIVVLNIAYLSSEDFGKQFVGYFGDTMLYLMIYTEVVSVLENIEDMAPKSRFVILFVRPLRLIIIFQLKQLLHQGNR